MTETATTQVPTFSPMLAYENAGAAIAFLTEAFGFTETMRLVGDDGRIGHAELSYGNGKIMLVDFDRGYQGPRHHAETCAAARQWLDNPYVVNGVYVVVEDVEAHFKRAEAAGATMLSGIEEGVPGKLYRAADPEGQRWMFNQPPAPS
ncbi:VOC family protein [Microlunatus parietis]|uniref:Putative glyoxalase superfamily protein PhnB n=1 Tax=Microlunatus parietis TaxID=682979 RepID=A0A7Y9I7B3_9ACTN|nr:VOC family protein [Microlunatus parietis]NYE71557.1 putative glyoxalase superfamily protein PhnB [Microlunatus parietis]